MFNSIYTYSQQLTSLPKTAGIRKELLRKKQGNCIMKGTHDLHRGVPMKEYKNRGFMLKQRAFVKLYIFKTIDEHKGYAYQYLEDLRNDFESYGYKPSSSEIYKTLIELTKEGYVNREKKIKGEKGVDFQEIILYQLTDEGKKEYDRYKQQMKVELERCKGLLDKALRDHYGPVS